MFTNVFGNFLVTNNYISKEQLLEIKNAQKETRVKLGLIAVSERLLTDAQAVEINRKQAVMDKRFGDIAVELGYLTEEQVSRLLGLQGNPYMQFSQAMTDKGFMALTQIEEALASFQKENGFTATDMDAFKSGDIDRIIPLFLPVLPKEEAKELIEVSIRTVNRLISSDIAMKKAYITDKAEFANGAMQSMEGDYGVSTAFVGNGDSLLAIADAYAGENFGTVDMDALDSVGEFINVINGLFATSLSYKKVSVELMPPVFMEDKANLTGSGICVVPLEIDQKEVFLVVSVGNCIQA